MLAVCIEKFYRVQKVSFSGLFGVCTHFTVPAYCTEASFIKVQVHFDSQVVLFACHQTYFESQASKAPALHSYHATARDNMMQFYRLQDAFLQQK